MSRIMIASAKMRYFKIRGGGWDGDEAEAVQEINICNAHMHYQIAKRGVNKGASAYCSFWDDLAKYLVCHRCRYLCGDFNMALFSVVPEMRARGFQINMAAWYCWQHEEDVRPKVDSCGIFRIGPCQGIRMCFDASVFGFINPEVPSNYSMVMETVRNAEGKEIEKRNYPVPKFSLLGQGYHLTSYRPLDVGRREMFVKWTFVPVEHPFSSAVAGIMSMSRNEKAFPFGVPENVGKVSWDWPEDVCSKQKLVSHEMFDPSKVMWKGGAHMPLMIFVGGVSDTRRSPGAQRRRNQRADERGWNHERRQAYNKGSGQSKGKGQGKGRAQVWQPVSTRGGGV